MKPRYLHVCQGAGRFKRTLLEPINSTTELAAKAWLLDYRLNLAVGYLDRTRYWFVASRPFGKYWESPV